jgi:hypothetical protein
VDAAGEALVAVVAGNGAGHAAQGCTVSVDYCEGAGHCLLVLDGVLQGQNKWLKGITIHSSIRKLNLRRHTFQWQWASLVG